ncbi:MAG: hypothetical protein WD276_07675 [Actinomycetota bacterium]
MAESRTGASTWIIAGAIVAAGLLIASAVYLSRAGGGNEPSPLPTPQEPPSAAPASPLPPGETVEPPSPAKQDLAAQRSLQTALDSAVKISAATKSFARANAQVMADVEPRLTYEAGGTASAGPANISILAAGTFWSAAAQSQSGTCFWIKHSAETGSTTYGVGVPCTGAAAFHAESPSWPAA